MLKNLKADNIYIVCGHTDMRKTQGQTENFVVGGRWISLVV